MYGLYQWAIQLLLILLLLPKFMSAHTTIQQNIDSAEQLRVKDKLKVPTQWLRFEPVLSTLQDKRSNAVPCNWAQHFCQWSSLQPPNRAYTSLTLVCPFQNTRKIMHENHCVYVILETNWGTNDRNLNPKLPKNATLTIRSLAFSDKTHKRFGL